MPRSILIRRGHILTMDPDLGDLPAGDILVHGSTIAKVGTQLDDSADDVIDASGRLVLPGLVDTHIHLWQTVLRGLGADLWKGEYFTHVLPYRERPRDGHPLALPAGKLTGQPFRVMRGQPDVVEQLPQRGRPPGSRQRDILGQRLLERGGHDLTGIE